MGRKGMEAVFECDVIRREVEQEQEMGGKHKATRWGQVDIVDRSDSDDAGEKMKKKGRARKTKDAQNSSNETSETFLTQLKKKEQWGSVKMKDEDDWDMDPAERLKGMKEA